MKKLNNKQIKILFFGDSNTWGYQPIGQGKFVRLKEQKYSQIVKKELELKLKQNIEIIEEGLNGRTIFSFDKRGGKVGCEYLKPCLESHDPIDYVVIMLGTNEFKDEFNNSANFIADMFEKNIIKQVINYNGYFDKKPNLIIVAPPHLEHRDDNAIYEYAIKEHRPKQLEKLLYLLSQKYECGFLSAHDLPLSMDGEHLTIKSHEKLGNIVCQKIFVNELKKQIKANNNKELQVEALLNGQ
ncbi:MAG: GDSL-type esterase/lipase family protein [Spirochaetales bacterium]